MQKRVLSSAIALALTALVSGTALAQSSVTLYGNIDVSVDHAKRTAGKNLTAPASSGPIGAATAAALSSVLNSKQSLTRVGSDTSSQSSLGFRGVEDLGGGYKGNFVLEGQMSVDNGALLRDGRLFGRQAYVGLTTPFGEFRAGRQYAPVFFSSALVTTERFGSTDQFVEGGLSNNLNTRWDNALTYSLQAGGFRGQLGYSPNAGVAQKVNALRNNSGGSDANGQILGGLTAGNENEKGRGRSLGAFGAYTISDLTVTLGYGSTNFANTPVTATVGGTTSTLFQIDDYKVWNLGGKYVLKDLGLTFSGSFGRANYDINSAGFVASLVGLENGDLKVSSLVLGTRYEIGALAFLAQWSETKFRNESRGKNHAYTLGAEYSLSKRTTLYTRYEQIRDKGVGPAVTLAATGIREVPTIAGLGLSPDGKATQLALGIRHSF